MSANSEWPPDKDRKSLQELTKHFVDIIRSSENGCLNLREVSDTGLVSDSGIPGY